MGPEQQPIDPKSLSGEQPPQQPVEGQANVKINIPGLEKHVRPDGGVEYRESTSQEQTPQESASKEPSLWERAKGALKNTIGSKDFWFRERTLDAAADDSRAMRLTKNMLKVGAAVGNPLYNMAATLGGVKVLESATLYWLQTREVRARKKEITELLSGEGKFADKQAQIQSILENASMAKKLTPEELVGFQAALQKASEGDEYECDAQYEKVVDNYLRAKTSGHEVVKQGLNSLFMLTGMSMVRAGVTLTMKGVELYAESKLEKDRGSEQDLGEILRSKFVESAKKKVSWMYDKQQTKMQRFTNAAEALGMVGTFVGLGNAALSEINAGKVTAHMSEAVHNLGSSNAGSFMAQNFEANMQRNMHLYGDGFQNAYKGMKGLLNDVKESFFGAGAAKATALREAAAMAHGGGTSDGVQEVSGMTRGSSTGLKDGVNYESVGSVGKPSVVDMDGVQQAEGMSEGRPVDMEAADRTLDLGEEVIVGERPRVRELDLGEETFVAKRPHVINRPEYAHVREALRGGQPKFVSVDDRLMTPAEQAKLEEDMAEMDKKIDAKMDEMMAKRAAAASAVNADDAHKAGIKERVRAEADKALAGIDKVLAAKPKGSGLGDELAKAQAQEGPRGGADEIQGTGESPLRMRLNEIDRKGRELLPPDDEVPTRQGPKFVEEMKLTLGGSLKEHDFGMSREAVAKQLVRDLKSYGFTVQADDKLAFKVPKAVAERLGGDKMLQQAYQVGVLEREARELPAGPARDAVIAAKKQLQGDLEQLMKKTASAAEKLKVKKMIAAVAKNPDKF